MNSVLGKNWSLDHVGHAVADLDEAIKFYQNIFGFTLDIREKLPAHGVEIAFLKLANTTIELLAPLGGDDSKLAKFLKRNGPGLHHVCYRVDDIRAELARLQGLGLELIDQAPRTGAHQTEIAFLQPRSTLGVLVELCAVKK